MYLATLEKRLQNPGVFERNFFDFWDALGVKTDQEKTLAEQTRYDSRQLINGVNQFFKSDVVPNNTNLNQFTPPESEHQLITTLRIWEGTAATVFTTDWVAGASSAFVSNSKITITNNGVKAIDAVPLSDFLPDLTTKDNGLYDLSSVIPWIGQTNLVVSVETPENFGVPINLNLRIGLKGLAYIS